VSVDPTSAPASAREEASALLRLSGPVVLGQAGLFAMGVTDTLMVGRVSAEALAAVALGALFSFMVLGSGRGLLTALDPVLSQALGARDHRGLRRGFQRGVLLALLISGPAALAMLLAEPTLRLLRQPEEIVPTASLYALISAAGAPAFLGFTVLRQTLQALHSVRPIVIAVLLANAANVLFNWLLVFGHCGLPPLGPLGSAWATVLARWTMLLALVLLSKPSLAPLLRRWEPEVLRPRPLLRLAGLGAPLGLQHFVEIGTFSAVALFMGWLGARELAAHQIAIQLASAAFMVPLGVSSAASVRVGLAVGRGDPRGTRRAAAVALGCGAAVMLLSGTAFAVAPELLARAFSPEAAIVAAAASLIRIAAIFQVFDGLQVVAIGVLRGVGDTRAPMLVNVLGFWCLGIPTSLGLAFGLDLGAEGLWWGLVVGLLAVAACLLLRVRARLSGPVARIDLDDPSGRAG
jgi:MATE family multidrug resistance protein